MTYISDTLYCNNVNISILQPVAPYPSTKAGRKVQHRPYVRKMKDKCRGEKNRLSIVLLNVMNVTNLFLEKSFFLTQHEFDCSKLVHMVEYGTARTL